MKRGLTLLLASLVLAVSLTACGGDTKNNQNGDAVLGGGDKNTSQTHENGSGSVNGNNSASGNGNGDAITGSMENGMADIENGLDDTMRDAGDTIGDMMDDLAGDNTRNGTNNTTRSTNHSTARNSARTTPQNGSGPAWQGNLKKPSFPGTAGRSL